jgi:hypothetical protein
MFGYLKNLTPIAVLICSCAVLLACGGGSDAAPPANPLAASAPSASPPAAAPATIKLNPPVLSFTETGVSVSDGYTNNGLWTVSNDGLGWEYSIDMGNSWIRGVGASFEVKGDGPKTIWVRSVDVAGNRSDFVMVNCVLDTMAPQAVSVAAQSAGVTRILQIEGLETGSRWEYSLDDQATWWAGSGKSLGLLGNDLSKLWIRQWDIAGNASAPKLVDIAQIGSSLAHEASNDPLQPSLLTTT